MKANVSWSRWETTIPGIAVLIGIGAGVLGFVISYIQGNRDIAREELEEARFACEMAVAQLEHNFRIDRPSQNRYLLEQLASDRDLQFAAVIDTENQIRFATDSLMVGQPLADSPLAPFRQELATVSPTGTFYCRVTDGGDRILAAYGYHVPQQDKPFLYAPGGVLAILFDLQRSQARLADRLMVRSLLLAAPLILLGGLVGFGLSRTFSRRMQFLMRQVAHSSENTEKTDAPLQGQDELAELSRMLATMSEKRREAERQLLRLNRSLEARVAERTTELAETNAELESFAQTVSHDLRAPLRAMEGFAAALAEDYGEALQEEGREFVNHITASAKRMDQLIVDLLDYSCLGRRQILLENVELTSVVDQAMQHLEAELRSNSATVSVRQPLPAVRGHRNTLLQIVTNLVANGLKFVPPGQSPVLRIYAERSANGRIRLSVEDNGIGIAPEYQERIFSVFERLHSVDRYAGTGIGLAIVARGCQRLGGHWGVESEPGKGSRFWIEFPAAEPSE